MRAALALTAVAALGPAALLGPTPVSAQAPSDAWFAAAFYDGDYFAGDSPIWTDWSGARALTNRRFDGGTAGLEVGTTHRFDLSDRSVAGDLYLDVREGAYAHLRGRVTPGADLLPLSDWRLEVFHALPGGWEASASVWLMNHGGPDVRVVGLGAARYVRQWFLRAQGSLAEIADETAGAVGVFARRFLDDDSRQFVELGAGRGSEVAILGPGPVLDARETWFLAGTYQRFLTERYGVHVSLGLHDFEGVPRRRHLSVGAIARF